MFWLPNFFSLFFLLVGLLNLLQANAELESLRDSLKKKQKAFFALTHCVRLKTTYHNLKDSCQYLMKKVSIEEQTRLVRLCNNLFMIFSSEVRGDQKCFHKDLPGLFADKHKQENSGLDPLWPNWVPAYYSVKEGV